MRERDSKVRRLMLIYISRLRSWVEESLKKH